MKTIKIKNYVIGEEIPKVAVSLMGKNFEDIKKKLEQLLDKSFSLLEWRMDYLEDYSIQNVLEIGKYIQTKANQYILLYTFRTQKEGGQKAISIQDYIDLNRAIIEAKICDCIDVEMFIGKGVARILCDAAHMQDIYVVGSNHDFDKTTCEDNIVNRFLFMQLNDADICKIAMMPNSKEDVYTLMRATHTMKEKYANRPLVSMSMGELGKASRIFGELFGSSITFGCVDRVSAPGQIEISKLNSCLEDVHQNHEKVISKYMK